MLSNPLLSEAILDLKSAYRKSKAPIWLNIQQMLEKRRSKIEVNLNRLSKLTDAGSVVVVPGKVLGTGNMDHKITLCAFSLSQSAATKIVDAGGKIISMKELIEKFPEGSKVKIIA